jgi:hypothetical protein
MAGKKMEDSMSVEEEEKFLALDSLTGDLVHNEPLPSKEMFLKIREHYIYNGENLSPDEYIKAIRVYKATGARIRMDIIGEVYT